MNVLFAVIGNRDPYRNDSQEFGPILSLLEHEQFNRVYLFYTGTDYLERGRLIEEKAADFGEGTQFKFIEFFLSSVIDYEEIYGKMSGIVANLKKSLEHSRSDFAVLLDPGTPQMQTCWFLLVRSGFLNARLIQGIPPQFAEGAYKAKDVILKNSALPRISIPSEEAGLEARVFTGPGEVAAEIGEEIVGGSRLFRICVEKAVQVAAYEISVLLRGETGTGKGVVAKIIHRGSSRKDKPFLVVNCAAVNQLLAESAFFGHRKGSFTGAEEERTGYFRAADGGTIFLDEVGDLSLDLQAKLLQVLEDGMIFPLGYDHAVKVDVRLIAATNRDIEQMIEDGSFRRDLFERINTVTLELPALRERCDDIPSLASLFLDDWNRSYHESKTLSEAVLKYFLDYPWPGNVRELQNAVQSMAALGHSPGTELDVDLLPPKILIFFNQGRDRPEVEIDIPRDGINLKAWLFQMEKRFYTKALERTGGNKEEAAELLQLNAPAFRKALRERFNESG